jgi:DNA-binding transcriptional ArsR family regulator
MKNPEVVSALAALAHKYRLDVYRLLVREGPAGLPAGAIGERIGLGPSSLTFHLQALQRAGLIKQARVRRQLFYSADYAVMSGLVNFLTDECCSGAAVCHSNAETRAATRKSRSAKAA